MTADQRHLDVPELLRDWADAQQPEPSAALHDFLAGATPLAAAASARAGGARTRSASHRRAATRTGLTVKAAVVLTALTITSAAAAGIAQVVGGSGSPAPERPGVTAPSVPGDDLGDEGVGSPDPSVSVTVVPAPSSARPTRAAHSAEPAEDPSADSSEDAPDSARPTPSAVETDAPEPSATSEATGAGSSVEPAGASTPAADPTDTEAP